MGLDWLGAILGGGAKGVLEGVGGLAKDIRAAITGEEPMTAEQKAELLLKASAMEAAAQQAAMNYDTVQMGGQIELNKIEAASPSTFKSGWRPALGWVCVLGFFYSVFLRPVLPWFITVCSGTTCQLPPVDMIEMSTLLAGMLGLGTMRTMERIKGVSAN